MAKKGTKLRKPINFSDLSAEEQQRFREGKYPASRTVRIEEPRDPRWPPDTRHLDPEIVHLIGSGVQWFGEHAHFVPYDDTGRRMCCPVCENWIADPEAVCLVCSASGADPKQWRQQAPPPAEERSDGLRGGKG